MINRFLIKYFNKENAWVILFFFKFFTKLYFFNEHTHIYILKLVIHFELQYTISIHYLKYKKYAYITEGNAYT